MDLYGFLRKYGLPIIAILVIGSLVLAIFIYLYLPVILGEVFAPQGNELTNLAMDPLPLAPFAQPGAMEPAPQPATSRLPALGDPRIKVVANGLLNPSNLAYLPDGALLIAEAGTGDLDHSAGLSLLVPSGQVGRLVSGLPSGSSPTGIPAKILMALSPDQDQIYLGGVNQTFFGAIPLTAGQQGEGMRLPVQPLLPRQLMPVMTELDTGRLLRPFDIAFDLSGTLMVFYISDGGWIRVSGDGTTRFMGGWDPLLDPTASTTDLQVISTGIAMAGEESYLTLASGRPCPVNSGRLVAIRTDGGQSQRTVAEGLNMPWDVTVGVDGTLWVLEFGAFTAGATCFERASYVAGSGQLSRLHPDGWLEKVITGLNAPNAVLAAPDGSLYISESYSGQILRVFFVDSELQRSALPGKSSPAVGSYHPSSRSAADQSSLNETAFDLVDAHATLHTVIDQLNLKPNPGAGFLIEPSATTELGRALFFDPILSGDQNIACATCHHPQFAMADGRSLPIGGGGEGLGPQRRFVQEISLGPEADAVRQIVRWQDPVSGESRTANPFVGQFIPRNSPTIINSALLSAQFWDGRVQNYGNGAPQVQTLEDAVNQMGLMDPLIAQALFPITSLHEMAGVTLGALPPPTIRNRLLDRLRAIPEYVRLFERAFDGQEDRGAQAITLARMGQAIAAFERLFIFTDAPWDAYLAGDDQALSPQALQGALLFFGAIKAEVNCAVCHAGDLFTDMGFHNILTPQLGPGKGHGDSGEEDWGRGRVTFDRRDQFAFRTPSLRNVTLTAPYLHSGAYATLETTIRHHNDVWAAAATYDPRANQIPEELYDSVLPFNPDRQILTVAPILASGLSLTEPDIALLAAFLSALTDPAAQNLTDQIPDRVPSNLSVERTPAP